jgi:hypothetical protein
MSEAVKSKIVGYTKSQPVEKLPAARIVYGEDDKLLVIIISCDNRGRKPFAFAMGVLGEVSLTGHSDTFEVSLHPSLHAASEDTEMIRRTRVVNTIGLAFEFCEDLKVVYHTHAKRLGA